MVWFALPFSGEESSYTLPRYVHIDLCISSFPNSHFLISTQFRVTHLQWSSHVCAAPIQPLTRKDQALEGTIKRSSTLFVMILVANVSTGDI